MSVTRIDIDDEALGRAMALSGSKTKKDAVNLALRFYAEKQERAARIARHFERARHWVRSRTPSACTRPRNIFGAAE